MLAELGIVIDALKADFYGLETSKKQLERQNTLNISGLLELAHHHGCIWEVVAYCKCHDLFTSQEIDLARALTMQSTAHAMQHEQALIHLSAVFEDNGLPYALLKGAAIYPQFRSSSEQQSRQTADIDLLVSANDIEEAVTLLLGLGYECDDCSDPLLLANFVRQHDAWFRQRDLSFSLTAHSIQVDLHWRVAYPFSLPMQTPDLLSRVAVVDIQKHSIKCLSFNDHFILLCVHGYLDQFFILKHLADIFWAKQHPDFDHEKVYSLAKFYGVEKQVDASCLTADLFFGLNQGNDNDKIVEAAAIENGIIEKKGVTNSAKHFNEYSVSTLRRYQKFSGKPPRLHQAEGVWSFQDKVAYIQHQINTRSQKAFVLAPLIHRLKYDIQMIEVKPRHCSALLAWPLVYLKKLVSAVLS